ncbi:general secretion pathway protein B [Geoalkalibacter ferrihydriticus]|uniref:General secretion pathway protein B n=1 Tax=Geoalkalibacter ferrihydriticus TaxID=392333 RepID=A0A1G9UBL9_9BACT|nr:general secretion pathway protein GspB [Geoalkalibacter ferrihydriticus]SDM57357.1 general secretion pathway protein B [Geoalkalibacter ferrihydriticus]
MSFILDALRKSDKNRPAGMAPDLRTEHFAPSVRSRRKASPLLLVLSVALLLNAALLIWWLRPWQPVVEDLQVAVPATETAAPAEISGTLAEVPPSLVPPQIAVVPSPQAVPESPPVATPAPSAELVAVAPMPVDSLPELTPRQSPVSPDRAPKLEDLSASLRSGLPDFTFSLHYYTADPAQRLVRLNGLILREGQALSEGLVLEEITSDGAVFGYQGLLFTVKRY